MTHTADTLLRKLSGQSQQRSARYQRDSINAEARTVDLAFASEEPYDRWWGTEVLDCTTGAVDLAKLNARHPLLLDHDRAQQIGVVERAWVDADRRCRATVRFGRSALAEEIWQDVQDGIRELVSVGYQIGDMVLQDRSDDHETYRVTRWTPYEVSIVSVPADATVGVGRSLAAEAPTAQPKDTPMSETTTAAPAATQQPDIQVIANRAQLAERERSQELRAIGQQHSMADEAARAIDSGTTVDAFRAQVLAKLVERGAVRPAASDPRVGLSARDLKQFSIARLIAAMQDPHDKKVRDLAGLEIEASYAARQVRPIDEQGRLGAERAAGFTVPYDVLAARDLNVGTATAGGNLVATDLQAGSFIDLLRNKLVLAGLGARTLDGLVGNIAIPSQTGGAVTYWVTEGNNVTESEMTVGQVAMSPKTVGTFTDYSRRTLLQATPSIEALVRADLAAALASGIDAAGITGSGSSGQPRGIINTVGIGAVPIGTNGGVPTYAHMVQLEEQISIANADVASMAYLTNARMRAQLKLTQVFASTNGTPVWQGDQVNGYRAEVTNSVPSNLTKGTASGVCSAIVMGNWSDLLIGMWGGLDLVADPYTLATSGGRRIVALQDVDVAVRRVASFAAVLDALRA